MGSRDVLFFFCKERGTVEKEKINEKRKKIEKEEKKYQTFFLFFCCQALIYFSGREVAVTELQRWRLSSANSSTGTNTML
jgi:hypothetical protein